MAEKLDKTGETLIIRYVDMQTKSIPNPTPALGYLLQRVPNQQNATNIHMTKKKKKSLSPSPPPPPRPTPFFSLHSPPIQQPRNKPIDIPLPHLPLLDTPPLPITTSIPTPPKRTLPNAITRPNLPRPLATLSTRQSTITFRIFSMNLPRMPIAIECIRSSAWTARVGAWMICSARARVEDVGVRDDRGSTRSGAAAGCAGVFGVGGFEGGGRRGDVGVLGFGRGGVGGGGGEDVCCGRGRLASFWVFLFYLFVRDRLGRD